jgi:4-aminobutyrate aminotransferase / (S)-3-amino-2-methylpropionate transaminase / 5-aminovalerate transaminase
MATSYSLEPVDVAKVKTKYRTIKTKIPVPESIPIFDKLKASEPRSMLGQPPIIWDMADDFIVGDRWGNRWIDWSSGVLITNAGHGRKRIVKALSELLKKPLLTAYVFVHEGRAELTEMLAGLAPNPTDYSVFLLSTGSEAIENALKLARTYAIEKHGPKKNRVISFGNAFHGRTMGSQLAGGMQDQKAWIAGEGSTFAQVPFPDGYKNEDTSFDLFLSTLKAQRIKPESIAAVITESYQGVGPDFLPYDYAQKLQEFCREHDICMIYDEVQSGFGRTGKMFCFEHYGVTPDLITCGKGISSSLPISAVIGRKDIMDLYPPGSMTSTHSASPLPVAAAIENIKIIHEEGLVEHAAELESVLMSGLKSIQEKYPDRLGCLHGKGLVAGLQVVKPGTKEPDSVTATKINVATFQRGVLMFAPVGIGGECLKISPPLTIPRDALDESIAVFAEACDEVLGS